MKAVLISDTHEQHDRVILPDGDLLIHCGDWTYRGVSDRMQEFWEWFSSQRQTYKVAIAGNHDLGLDASESVRNYNLDMIKSYTRNTNVFYLEDSGCVIEDVNIWGSPISPRFYDWAFNRDRGSDIMHHWNKIPLDTDVLLTHGPRAFVLDNIPGDSRIVGCEDLGRAIDNLSGLTLHVSGHIHQGYGTKIVNGVRYVNASTCNGNYQPINPPIVVEI